MTIVARNEKRRDAARPAFEHLRMLAFDDAEPADAAADVDADLFGILVVILNPESASASSEAAIA